MNKCVRKNSNSIDLFKFIMAFAVVAIHTRPFIGDDGTVYEIYDSLVNLAVPFFFLSSGFLLMKRMDNSIDTNVLYKHLIKMVKMYIFWMIIYSPMTIYRYIVNDLGFVKSVLYFCRGFFLLGQLYNSWHLWYLLATIYSLVLIVWLMKKDNIYIYIYLLYMCIFFIFVSIGLDGLVRIDDCSESLKMFQKIIKVSVGNGRIFRGMIYIPLGMEIGGKRYKLSTMSNTLILGISFVLNCFIKNIIISELLIIISSVCMFCLIVQIDLCDNEIYLILREMSSSIYFIHMYVWSFYYKLFYREIHFGFEAFAITAFISCILAFFSWKMKSIALSFMLSKNDKTRMQQK